MSEESKPLSNGKGNAGPNAQELDWAFNAAAEEAAAANIAVNAQGVEFEGDEDDIDEDDTQQPTASTSASVQTSSASAKKKKKSKLAKLKKKLAAGKSEGDGVLARGTTDEPVPDQVFQAVKQRMQETAGDDMANKMTPELLSQLLKQADMQEIANGKAGVGNKSNKKDMADYKFWDTQPVPKLGAANKNTNDGPIEADKADEELRREPYPLPETFVWSTVDLDDDKQLQEVYDLLTAHYVEDDDASFRFDYTAEFIRWALKPPGFVKDWHIGVRVAMTKKLVAFIAGIPMNLRIRDTIKYCSEINFLCVHKKLRAKRLAPVLIKEVTRRCHLVGVFQAIYTAGVFLPTPVSRCQYYHRTLNLRKLVATGFTSIPRHQTMSSALKVHALPATTSLPGLREIEAEDVPQVATLLRNYMSRFDLSPIFSDEEVSHHFVSSKGDGEAIQGKRKGQVTWSYVVEDPSTHEITDFFSFYYLPSTAIKAKQIVEAAYMFYYASNTAGSLNRPGFSPEQGLRWDDETDREVLALKKRLVRLVGDALIIARDCQFDVFNAVTLMDNSLFVHELKFGPGDGFLHYYLYNWMTQQIPGGIPGAEGMDDSGNRTISAPPPGMSSKEVGSGIGVVML